MVLVGVRIPLYCLYTSHTKTAMRAAASHLVKAIQTVKVPFHGLPECCSKTKIQQMYLSFFDSTSALSSWAREQHGILQQRTLHGAVEQWTLHGAVVGGSSYYSAKLHFAQVWSVSYTKRKSYIVSDKTWSQRSITRLELQLNCELNFEVNLNFKVNASTFCLSCVCPSKGVRVFYQMCCWTGMTSWAFVQPVDQLLSIVQQIKAVAVPLHHNNWYYRSVPELQRL